MPLSQLEIPLSVLDATVIGPGISPVQAMRWTQDVALMADRHGFHRFWVVEHHSVPDIGCGRPTVLMAHLAALTQRLRIGSGGVMLPNHSAFAVAEEFALLCALHPGRIDLGIGRAGSHDPDINHAMGRRPDNPAAFEAQLEELLWFLGNDFPSGHRYQNIRIPLRTVVPPTYVLGTSPAAATLAARRGLAFAFAHHLNPTDTVQALATYRAEFQGRSATAQPHAIITVAAICAETQAEADAAALRTMIPRIRRGLAEQHKLTVPDEVLLYPEWSENEVEAVRQELSKGWILCGSSAQVKEGLIELAQRTGADEIMLTAIEYDGPGRLRTLGSIANTCLIPTLER